MKLIVETRCSCGGTLALVAALVDGDRDASIRFASCGDLGLNVCRGGAAAGAKLETMCLSCGVLTDVVIGTGSDGRLTLKLESRPLAGCGGNDGLN